MPSYHLKLILTNLKFAWRPPNTTSLTHPMNQGTINCVEINNRHFFMQSLIANIDKIHFNSKILNKNNCSRCNTVVRWHCRIIEARNN